jgi:hypothetical protein
VIGDVGGQEIMCSIPVYPENVQVFINPLNTQLNPICHLLALLAYPILHVSRIRVYRVVSTNRTVNMKSEDFTGAVKK